MNNKLPAADTLLKPEQVAERLACSARMVQRLATAREIEHYRIGRVIGFTPAAVDAYLMRQTRRAVK